MPEPVKVNVVSYGGARPGQVVASGADGRRAVWFDASSPSTSIKYGRRLFYGRTDLTSWNYPLDELTDGESMFNGARLTSFKGSLPKLTNGNSMFWTCVYLEHVEIEPQGNGEPGLAALTNGESMFGFCQLDEASVLSVLGAIVENTSGKVRKLHLGKRTNFKDSPEVAELLNTETPIAASDNYSYKGWTINVQA